MSSSQQATASKLDLPLLIDELFLVLTPKEKEVITKRFSLDAKPRMTLESIGRKFSVTRERVRQIEKIALTKLRRTVQSSKLIEVDALIDGIIETYGGICTEKTIITEILNALKLTTEIDGNIIRLALNINPAVVKAEKSNELAPFWRKKEIPIEDVYKIIEVAIARLNEQNDVVPEDQLAEQIRNKVLDGGKQFSKLAILSALDADMRIKKTKEGLGLATWRHINPKSIRDKAYIVLKKHGQPLHFVEIANKIIEYGFDKKIVTVQAVHNELIRYDQFVLVGRGLYALKEWGYKKGTVAEIIEGLLAKKSPLTKAEIITGVLKQRKVKKGTISLNLQKNPHFVRVGRAVYGLKK